MEESWGAVDPSTYLDLPMFTLEQPSEQINWEDLLRSIPDPNSDPHPHPAQAIVGRSTATGMESMEIQHLGNVPGEVNSLGTNAGLTQPEPCAVRTNSSTVTDKEITDYLHARFQGKESPDPPELNADLAGRLDPWNLPVNQRYYRTNRMSSCLDEKTDQGYWKKESGLEAMFCDTSVKKLRYFGLKWTFAFHLKDGTKTYWRMTEYLPFYLFDGVTFLEPNLVFRRVFDDGAHGVFNTNPSTNINGECEDEPNRSDMPHSDCLHHATGQNNQTPPGKRARKVTGKSDVWQHFTRIFILFCVVDQVVGSTEKKGRKKLIYAVCNYCDKVFHADSTNGTSHHKRHAEACLSKH